MRRAPAFVAFGLVLVGALLASNPTRAHLPLPPRDTVSAEWLPDGTPVFVVHQGDGVVHVVGATARLADPIDAAVAWCPAMGVFFSVWAAGMFLEDGRLFGGLGPSLAVYPSEIGPDGVVVMGGPNRSHRPVARTDIPERHRGGIDTSACFDHIGLRPQRVIQHDVPAVRAHTPDQLHGRGHGEVVLVRGVLARDTSGRLAVCERLSPAPPRRCEGTGIPLVPHGHELVMPIMDVVVRGRFRSGELHRPVLVTVTKLLAFTEDDSVRR